MESIPVMPAFLINWGWLRIGPYIHINIDPVILHILIPLTLWVRRWRYASVIPAGEVPATAGIPQKSELEATHAERNTALEERGRKENADVTHPS